MLFRSDPKNDPQNSTADPQASTKIISPLLNKPVDIVIIPVPPTPDPAPSGSVQPASTPSVTTVPSSSATQEYQESDQHSAEAVSTSLGLANPSTNAAMSPARLQMVMQSAAMMIRKYPANLLNP